MPVAGDRQGLVVSAALASVLAACGSPAPGPAAAGTLALAGVSVVDVEHGRLLADQTVTIEKTTIRSVGPRASADLSHIAQVVDAGGKFLVPGLWDTHVHLTPFGEDVLPLFLAYGVTAVRDAGGTDAIYRWREEVAAGTRVGPRIWTSGRMLTQTRSEAPGPEWDPVESPEQARRKVGERQADGADFLKLQDSFMSRDLWSAAGREAVARGLAVAGHAPVDLSIPEAIELGLRSIEHTMGLPLALSASEPELRKRVMQAKGDPARWEALYAADVEALSTVDASRLAALAALMRERGVALSPNLTDSRAMATAPSGRWNDDARLDLVSPAIRKLWREAAASSSPTSANTANLQKLYERIPAIVLALHRAGVTILAGTDAWATYDFPGSDMHSELWHLVQAGLTPLEALRTATLTPARYMKVAESLGSIAPGKLADLVLLDGNPLDDIRQTERISAVIANGQYRDRAALDRIFAEARRAAGGDGSNPR